MFGNCGPQEEKMVSYERMEEARIFANVKNPHLDSRNEVLQDLRERMRAKIEKTILDTQINIRKCP